ncbi:MAG: lytic transglycosylase domain-containing protein [Bdellovibrionia bacterium]
MSNGKRLDHVKDLLGHKLARKVGAMDARVPHVLDKFIFEKVKNSIGNRKKIRARQVANAVIEEANRHGFDPMFLLAVIKRESSFNEEARGDFGEIGLMQIKPDTGEWIAKKSNLKWKGERSLLDPVQNIRIGSAYLAYLRKRLPTQGLYVSAYNMGPKNVRELLAKNSTPKEYLTDVLDNYEDLYSEVHINKRRTIAGSR